MTDSSPLDPHERRRIEDALDRLEERLIDLEFGVHHAWGPADPEALRASGLPESAAMFWARFDGIELAAGEACVFPLARHAESQAEAEAEGLLRPGDRVIGEHGRAIFVLPDDPWAEGGEVVRIDDEGERAPEASSVPHLVLGLLAEMSIVYDEHGEFRDDVYDEFGEIIPSAVRRLLRKRLDFDADAPRPRRDLARILREHGELRASKAELQQVLRRAPEWAAAHHELGLTLLAADDEAGAHRSFLKAAEYAIDDEARAYSLAWAASVGAEAARQSAAAQVLRLRPEFAAHQVAGARARLELEDVDGAREMTRLGLAVAPRNLELLALKRELDRAPDDDASS